MNETNRPAPAADVPWPTSDSRTRVPDTSMLPGSEKAQPAVVGIMRNAVHGAHDTIDRLADSAAPAVQQLGERVSAASDALHAKANQLRDTRTAWMEGARSSVRDNPLSAIAIAVAVGVVVARLTRRSR